MTFPNRTVQGLFVPEMSDQSLDYDPGGSLTWLKRLEKRISWRNVRLKVFDDYYRGHHKLQFATPKFKTTFGTLFSEFADNWVPLIPDAVAERMTPQGFRMGLDSDKGDKDAWYMWQANQLDADFKMAITESLLREESYLLVWHNPDNPKVPSMTFEDPGQMIVAYSAENRRKRACAVKFFDDDDGYPCATVYLPGGIYKYRSLTVDYRANDDFQNQLQLLNDLPAGGGSQNVNLPIAYGGQGQPLPYAGNTHTWAPREVDGEVWPLPNPLGYVPVIPIPNKPRLLGTPTSEVRDVIPIQDAVNKFLTDLLLSSEFAAFPARWASGLDIPIDPLTGKPALTVSHPGAITASRNPEARFGHFPEMSGDVHMKAIEMCVQHIASQSRTPPHYFYLSGHFPSGESIKSAETGLVAKVYHKMTTVGEALEEGERVAFDVLGDKRGKIYDSETIWKDPESRTESEHIDAVVKRVAIGVPLRQLQEDAGYTQAQIERFRQMRKDEIQDYVLAQAYALQEMAKNGVPDPNAGVGVAGSPAQQAAGAPVGLPNPTQSGQPQEQVSVPGSPVATTIRGPRTTL